MTRCYPMSDDKAPEVYEWDVMVRRAQNGFIVRAWIENFDDDRLVFGDTLIQETDQPDGVTEARLAMLWEVAEHLGCIGSRYDAKRIHIGTKPGDKHHDIHHATPCAECACQCDPDQSTPEEAI